MQEQEQMKKQEKENEKNATNRKKKTKKKMAASYVSLTPRGSLGHELLATFVNLKNKD